MQNNALDNSFDQRKYQLLHFYTKSEIVQGINGAI